MCIHIPLLNIHLENSSPAQVQTSHSSYQILCVIHLFRSVIKYIFTNQSIYSS